MSGSKNGMWVSRALALLGLLVLTGASPALGQTDPAAGKGATDQGAGAAPAPPKGRELPTRRAGMDGRRGPMHGNPDMMVKRLTKSLSLTEQQQAQAKKILEEQAKQGKALRQEAGQTTDREAMVAKMRKLRTDTDNKIDAILDDTQREKFTRMREERQRRFEEWSAQGRGARGGGPKGPARRPAEAPEQK